MKLSLLEMVPHFNSFAYVLALSLLPFMPVTMGLCPFRVNNRIRRVFLWPQDLGPLFFVECGCMAWFNVSSFETCGKVIRLELATVLSATSLHVVCAVAAKFPRLQAFPCLSSLRKVLRL